MTAPMITTVCMPIALTIHFRIRSLVSASSIFVANGASPPRPREPSSALVARFQVDRPGVFHHLRDGLGLFVGEPGGHQVFHDRVGIEGNVAHAHSIAFFLGEW